MSDLKAPLSGLVQRAVQGAAEEIQAQAHGLLKEALENAAPEGSGPAQDLTEEPQRTGQIRTRAEILVYLLDSPEATGDELANAVGLGSRQAVHHHIRQLREAGWIRLVHGRLWDLTPEGNRVSSMLYVWGEGEPIWRRLIRKHNGGIYDRAFAQRVETAGAVLDEDYKASWDGLSDRTGARVLRKATAAACIQAVKRHARWGNAAREAGIEDGALEQRLKKLMKYGEKPKDGRV